MDISRKIFDTKFFRSGQFVWAAANPVPPEKAGEAAPEVQPEVVPDKQAKKDRTVQLKQLERAVLGTQVEKTRQNPQAEIIDEDGEATEYVSSFKESPDFPFFTEILADGIRYNGKDTRMNFENWEGFNPEVIATIFDVDFIPKGRGRTKFLEGFKNAADPTKKVELDASKAVLADIIKSLKQHFEENKIDTSPVTINEKGTPGDYVNSFGNSKRFDEIVRGLINGAKSEGSNGLYNVDNWEREEPTEVADFLDKVLLFPQGLGRDKFFSGLRNSDAASQEFKDSSEALKTLSKQMREHLDRVNAAGIDVNSQLDKSPLPLSSTVGSYAKTFITNFNRGSSMDKALMLGAGALVVLLAAGKWNDKLYGETTYGKVIKFFGALWGVNYLSGKVSPDGKTLTQKLGIGLEVNEINDKMVKAFCYQHGMVENQEKLKTMLHIQSMDMNVLYDLYREAAVPGHSREIDPTRLGFHKGEANGAAVFEIIEGIVKDTAINARIRDNQEKYQNEKHLPYNKSMEEQDRQQLKQSGVFDNPKNAQIEFERKYFGVLGTTRHTLLDVIVNEYSTRDWQKIATEGEAALPINAAKRSVYELGKKAAEYGAVAGEYLVEVGGVVYKFSKENILIPVGNWALSKYNQLKPVVASKIKSVEAWDQENEGKQVLPAKFALEINEPKKATIMGYPGLAFDYNHFGGVKKVVIEGIEFSSADGIPGNKAKADELEKLINEKVTKLLAEQSRTFPQIAGKTAGWNQNTKKWEIKDVDVKGSAALGLSDTKANLTFDIQTDGKSAKFYFDNGSEVTDGAKVDQLYRDSVIEQKLIEVDPKLTPLLKGLGLTDVQVTSPYNAYGERIDGKLGGLEVHAVLKGTAPHTINNGLQFVDNSGTLIGPNGIYIRTGEKQSEDFLDAVSKQILASDKFRNPFIKLSSSMDNVSEGFVGRLKALFPDRWWIIPNGLPDVPAGINGQIIQRQWQYMLSYKQMESIERFKNTMYGKTLADLPKVYADTIDDSIKSAETLATSIMAEKTDNDRANKYKNFVENLENINYPNTQYRVMFKKFKDEISNDKYDYEGLESFGDVGTKGFGIADKAYESYQELIRFWYSKTNKFSVEDARAVNPKTDIHPDNQKTIDDTTSKVQGLLEILQSKSGGIKLEELRAELAKL